MEAWTMAAPWLGVAGLIAAFIIYVRLKAGDAGSAEMAEISDDIHDGAMAFLKREYSILLVFIAVAETTTLTSPVRLSLSTPVIVTEPRLAV